MLVTNVDMTVMTEDLYYGGPGDMVEGLTVSPLGEQFYGMTADIPGKSNGSLRVINFGVFPGNTPQLGLMLFSNGDRGNGNHGGATLDTEAMLFLAP